MSAKANSNSTTDGIAPSQLRDQFGEDPYREPHEKETALHLAGDGSQFRVTSFKRVVYEKLLQHSAFTPTRITVRDAEGRERTVDSLGAVADNPELTVIGVVGTLPVGAVTIGTPRTDDSQADIVTP